MYALCQAGLMTGWGVNVMIFSNRGLIGLLSMAAAGVLLVQTAVGAASYQFFDLKDADWPGDSWAGSISGDQVGGTFIAGGSRGHAVLWTLPARTWVDLNPGGFVESWVYGNAPGEQVGYGAGPATGPDAGGGVYPSHALLWRDSAASYVDLHPDGWDWSVAFGAGDGQQVGYGGGPGTAGKSHALLWQGSSASAVNLNPVGFTYSEARAAAAGQQIGFGSGPATQGFVHALLWSGSAASFVDLHPSGFVYSEARFVRDGQQVGLAGQDSTKDPAGRYPDARAILWTGTAASAVDLTPAGFTSCVANGVANGRQVGWGKGPDTQDNYHALLWSGSADSVVDLHQFVPDTFTSSYASAINASGVIAGYVVVYVDNGTGQLRPKVHAGLWVPGLLTGDCDGDGVVTIFDVLIVVQAFGTAAGDANYDARADINGDGVCNIFDVLLVISAFGSSTQQ